MRPTNLHSMSPSPRRTLFWLLVANVVATVFHYADNVCYFHVYPEPTWLNAKLVDAFWFVMTPLAIIGYLLVRHGSVQRGCLFLHAYAAASLLVLGHYRFAPFSAIAFRIHFFILLEAALAVALVLYGSGMQIRRGWPPSA